MPRSRRILLRSLALGGVALAGCVGAPPSDDTNASSTDGNSAGAETLDPESENSERSTPSYSRHDPVRAEGEPITVEEPTVVTDVEYLPERDAVKFPALVSGDEVVEYGTMPFERWAAMECASSAVDRVRTIAEQRLGGVSLGSGVTTRRSRVVIDVTDGTALNREGTPVSTPETSFDRLVEATPESATATVRLDDQGHTETVPVWVERTVVGYG